MANHESGSTSTGFDRVAVTALNNALLMGKYSDIWPWREISEIALRRWQAAEHAIQPELIDKEVNAPAIEVRYRLGSILAKNSVQLLEIASGLSPRGLTMTRNNPDITYVELDLPIMIDLKTRVLGELAARGTIERIPNNLHLEAGSALDPESVLRAASHFTTDRPVTIMSEGFLHYLPHDQKAEVAYNIRDVLSKHGGIWHTDMPIQKAATHHNRAMVATTTQQTGIKIEDNRFADEEEVKEFFAAIGLKVKNTYPYTAPKLLDILRSPHNLQVPMGHVVKYNRAWSMYAIGLPEAK